MGHWLMSNDTVLYPQDAADSGRADVAPRRKTWATPKVIESMLEDTETVRTGTSDAGTHS